MLKKPENYDAIEVKEFGEYTPIDLGGHKLVIKIAEEYVGQTGNTSLKVTTDTTMSDKQPNYFQEQFNNDDRSDKKWSNGAIKYVSLKDDDFCKQMLKAFITSVENSNQGFTYDWNKEVSQLNGKLVGGIFGIEEYVNQDGKTKEARKLMYFRSVDKVDNAAIPKVKLVDGTKISYDDYEEQKEEGSNPFNDFADDTVEIDDNFLD